MARTLGETVALRRYLGLPAPLGDAVVVADRTHRLPAEDPGQAGGQVGIADAGRAEEDDVLPALHEAELVQRLDLLSLDGGLEAEV